MKVYVLTDADAGWDCVNGVSVSIRKLYNSYIKGDEDAPILDTDDEIKEYLRKNLMIIHCKELDE